MPRSRLAGAPSSAPISAASNAPNGMAAQNGTPYLAVSSVDPYAPIAMNDEWHSEIWPELPVSRLSPIAAMTLIIARLSK